MIDTTMNYTSSAYIHIPFCKSKCAYCDFVSYQGRNDRINQYPDALCKEIELTKTHLDSFDGGFAVSGQGLRTVYFGGGTPSLLSENQIKRVLDSINQSFPIAFDAEITIEVNPGTVTLNRIKGYVDAGINRISIGIQSFSDPLLRLLGRIHTREQAIAAIDFALEAGIRNISCDLMLGLPGQTIAEAKESLSVLIEKGVPHISLYSLSLEDGTPFYERYSRTIDDLAPPEKEREMYHTLINQLKKRNYNHYEISNLALPGFESRHNNTYWKAESYLGFGCAAHSYTGGYRTENTSDLDRYIDILLDDSPALADITADRVRIETDEKQKEFMLLGFRLLEGVSGDEFRMRFGKDMEACFGTELEKHLKSGLLERHEDSIRLSPQGVDFANIVFRDFV